MYNRSVRRADLVCLKTVACIDVKQFAAIAVDSRSVAAASGGISPVGG